MDADYSSIGSINTGNFLGISLSILHSCWTIRMPFAYADCPVCLIPLSSAPSSVMYIGSAFPIDPGSSRQAMQSHCNILRLEKAYYL